MGVEKLDLARIVLSGRGEIETWNYFKGGGSKAFGFNSRKSQNWPGQPAQWVMISRNSLSMREVRILGGLSKQEEKANKKVWIGKI